MNENNKILCSFIPDLIEVYDLEKGKKYTWGEKKSKREDTNILVLDSNGNVLKKLPKSKSLESK